MRRAVIIFLWCTVTFQVSHLAGLFFDELKDLFMYCGGMAYLFGCERVIKL